MPSGWPVRTDQRQFNEAVFDQPVMRDGRIAEARIPTAFGLFFEPEFERSSVELQTGACSNFSDIRTRLEELAAAIRPA